MSQIYKSSPRIIEGVVPSVRVLIFVSLLNPLEYLEEGLELNFAVSQVDVFEAALVAFSAAFNLNSKDKVSHKVNGRYGAKSKRCTAGLKM